MAAAPDPAPGFVERWRQRAGAVSDWVKNLLPIRIWNTYYGRRGPVLAAGLGYYALFAAFAALWVGFSIAGLMVSGDLGLREEALKLIQTVIPGLIVDENGTGIFDPDLLLNASLYSTSGIVALVGLVFTALRWPAAATESARAVAGLPRSPTNAVLRRLRDLAFGVALGILIALTSLLGIAATGASQTVIGWLGLSSEWAIIGSRVATLVGAIILEAAALVGLYRVLAGLRAPRGIYAEGVMLATLGLTGLTIGGSLLVGSASSNPLIASFAVAAGLLIYFNLAGHVILLGATWIAVRAADAGHPIMMTSPDAAGGRG